MNALDLIKMRRNYIAAQRLLYPARYLVMDTFQNQFPGEFSMPGPGGPGAPGAAAEKPAEKPPVKPEQPAAGPGAGGPGGGMDFSKFMEKQREMTAKTMAAKAFLAGKTDNVGAAFGIPQEELDAALEAYNFLKKPIPDKCVILTFDDAMLNHIEMAGPILEKYNARGTFFVTEMLHRMGSRPGAPDGPGFEDKTFFMTWEQIHAMADAGHEVVSHSMNHIGFERLEPEQIPAQIYEMDERFKANGMEKPTVFAYPGGRCRPEHMELLAQYGYRWARGDVTGVKPERNGTTYYDPFLDSPLGTPSYNSAPCFDEDQIAEVLEGAVDNRVAVFAYHGVSNEDVSPLTFEEQVQCIQKHGGHIITYADLEEYIDPVKAYAWYKLGL